MEGVLKSICRIEKKFDRQAARFTNRHPLLAFGAMFIGMPILLLLTVSVSTVIITIPLACLFGWC